MDQGFEIGDPHVQDTGQQIVEIQETSDIRVEPKFVRQRFEQRNERPVIQKSVLIAQRSKDMYLQPMDSGRLMLSKAEQSNSDIQDEIMSASSQEEDDQEEKEDMEGNQEEDDHEHDDHEHEDLFHDLELLNRMWTYATEDEEGNMQVVGTFDDIECMCLEFNYTQFHDHDESAEDRRSHQYVYLNPDVCIDIN